MLKNILQTEKQSYDGPRSGNENRVDLLYFICRWVTATSMGG